MDLNLSLYLVLFLLLVGLFLHSLVRRRQEDTKERDAHSALGTGPVESEAEDRGQGE